MKRVNFDLMRAEEELAGARQCITCLCGATLTSSGAALLFMFGAMPRWGLAVAVGLLFLFLVAGLLQAFMPLWRERRAEAAAALRHRHQQALRQGQKQAQTGGVPCSADSTLAVRSTLES